MADYIPSTGEAELELNQPSGFQSFLRWLGRPGYAVRNLMHGDVGGSIRQLAELPLDLVDAVIPGDVIPQITKEGSDYTEASDLIGGMDPGLGKTAVDIIGGIATDPLTYTGVGLITKPIASLGKTAGTAAAKVASKTATGAKAVDEISKAASKAGHVVRAATGSLRTTPAVGSAIEEGTAIGGSTGRAGSEYAVKEFSKHSPIAQRRAIELIRGSSSELNPGAYTDVDALLAASGAPIPKSDFVTKADQMARIDARLNAMPWSPAEKAAARDAADKAVDFTRIQWSGGLRDKVFSQAEMYTGANGDLASLEDLQKLYAASPAKVNTPFDQWVSGIGYTKKPVLPDMAPVDYLPGKYELDQAATQAHATGAPSIIGAKDITDSKALTDFLNTNKAKLDDDLTVLLGSYAERMGTAVKQAAIGERLMPGFTSLAKDRKMFKQLVDHLKTVPDQADNAVAIETAVMGLPPRQGMGKLLADFNSKFFKPFATGGAFLPRPAFTTRNVVSGIEMVASDPASRAATLATAMRAPKDIIGAWGDGLRALGLPIAKPEYVDDVERAIAASGGDRVAMLAAIKNPTVRAAVENGVLDNGFIRSEDMVASLAQRAGGIKNWRNLRDYPQQIVKGGEDRMRLGLFTELTERGMPTAEAARITKKSLYDYAYSSRLNRSIRDVIPFFQFTAKAVPQQAKFLMESGAVPSLARNAIEKLYATPEGTLLPPNLQGNPVLPIGQDESGNPQYLTSLGMPYEALGQIPNPSDNPFQFFKQIRQDVVGASSPPLKTALAAVMGIDPYFGTPYGSFDRAPYALQGLGVDERGTAGRTYNMLAGTGMIQPLASPISTISTLMDPRTSGGETAVNVLTGARIKSVDETQALRQLLEEKLKMDPSIQRYETLYQQSPNAETQQLLDELKKVKSEIKKRKQEAKLQPH